MSDELATKPQVDVEPQADEEKDPIQLLIETLDGREFDTGLVEKKITIKDKGVVLECTIRELDQSKREEYMNFQAQKARYGPNGQVVGVKDMKGLQSKLVNMGLIGPNGDSIPEAVINKWSGSLIKKLADVIARLSALDNFAETRAKNS